MKKIVFAALSFLLLLTSCTKEATIGMGTGTATISANVDGQSMTYNVNAKAVRINVPGAYSVEVVGYKSSSSSDQIAISLTGISPIGTGTYSENNANGINVATINLIDGGSQTFVNSNSVTNPSSVTITSITSSSIKGTFKGDIFLSGSSSSTKKVLSEGQFSISF